MNRLVGNIQTKRAGFIPLDEIDGVFRDQTRNVPRLIFQLTAIPPIEFLHPVIMRLVIYVTTDVTPEFIETMFHRVEVDIVTEVPFAKDPRGIPGFLQAFGKGRFVAPQSKEVRRHFRVRVDHTRDSGELLIPPGQQPGPCRAADVATRMKIRKS